MTLKEGRVLYARIDTRIEGKDVTEQDAMDSMAYLQGLAAGRRLAAGVFGDMACEKEEGALVLFEAADFAEAVEISNRDPIIERGFYRYELRVWNVMLVSENSGT